MKIAILGGSFNPPHAGHIHISNIVFKYLNLDKIIWVLAKQNPLKVKNNFLTFTEKQRLCYEITKSHKYIEVKDLENDLFPHKQSVKTYEFLQKLKQRKPNDKIYFIIGADNLKNFHKWYRWQYILDNFNIVVVSRAGEKYQALASKAATYAKGKYTFINTRQVNISSTELRG